MPRRTTVRNVDFAAQHPPEKGRGFVNAAFGRGNGCPETRSGMERQTIARKIDVGSK